MKAEDINIAIEAVNKFIFFGWNFKHVKFIIDSYTGGEPTVFYVPCFIEEVNWDAPTCHMVSKWNSIAENYDRDAWMTKFYAELDNANRRKLIEYVMRNYNSEHKI